MSRWDNLLALVHRPCFATFGVPVTYTPALARMLGGTPIDLVGIFDGKREIVSVGGSGGMEAVTLHSVVEIKIADLGFDPMAGDDVAVAGLTYRILDVQPDGKGLAVLVLNQVYDPLAP
ncbi:MAG: hypothetical protein HQL95_00745 [Magnetococcales bacterium]|nr:hypothetical protein [Magnetococcales bacterium]